MNRSTPDAAVTVDPTHNTYATLGELHLDREQDLFRDVRVGCRRARGAPARARHVERRCRRRAAVRPTLLAARRPQAHGAMQVLAVLRYRLHSGIRGRVKICARTLLDCRASSTFSLLLLYVVKLYDVSVHLDLCARAPRVSQTAWSLLTFNKPVMCARLH